MARVWHDHQLRLWPNSGQIDRVAHRGAGVIAPVDDRAGNGVQLVGLRQQPTVLGEKALVLEVVVFDAGKGEGLVAIVPSLLSCKVGQQRQGACLP